ncbi:transposase [Companilactobacillus halodurans]|uniref:transposase n=1 Tax=Companilactobacillus halodurans TaxID=2584183 RepID=UPI003B52B897
MKKFSEIYSAIMRTNVKAIYNFVKKYSKSEISSFINSGFVEGNNNKVKLMGRIVYGETNFDNLFKKFRLVLLGTSDELNIDEFLN